MKKTWKVFPPAPTEFLQKAGLPPVAAQVLYNRGIIDPSHISDFLSHGSPVLHDPFLLPGMREAVKRLAKAIDSGQTIGVFGDFDVDGVTATALLTQGLGNLKGKVAPYIPHRVIEGHGLNQEAVQALKDLGVALLVTVDCGVTSSQEVSLAVDLGMDVIITDHHTPPSTLPPALAIVNPKIPDSCYPFGDLAGAGLAFKLMQGLYDFLGSPWPQDMLELAALGTVADLAPLKGENRSLVQEGLKHLRTTQRPGLQALYRKAGLHPKAINTEAISFIIAPRINASGRVNHAISSYRLLVARSTDESETLAAEIEAFNRERQQQTREAFELAKSQVSSTESLSPILLIASQGFSPGVSGLVASRLVEEFYRPAVVMALDQDIVRASGRSIGQFNLVAALYQCQDLFLRFGGHPQAAGFVMAKENLPSLKERLLNIASQALDPLDLAPTLQIDAEVAPGTLMAETYQGLMTLEPFGADNPTPVFLARNLRVADVRAIGSQKEHLRMKLDDGRVTWDAVAFRQGENGVPNTTRLDLVYSLTTNYWKGQEILTLKVLDFQPSTL